MQKYCREETVNHEGHEGARRTTCVPSCSFVSSVVDRSSFCARTREPSFDTAWPRFCPMEHVSSHQRYLLLSIDAGVWLGISETLPSPPSEAGGFCFHPLLRRPKSRAGKFSEILKSHLHEETRP